jgi:nicotinamidase-related amidase
MQAETNIKQIIMITAIDKNTALILIDLQKGILKRKNAHPITEVLGKAALLADAFRLAGLPVVVVRVDPFGAAWVRTRKDHHGKIPSGKVVQTVAKLVIFMTGYLDIVDEIKVQSSDIIVTKKTWNAFFRTTLQEELQRRNVTGIVLAGVATSIGVEGTARAASELGYNISFAIDAMTDLKSESHLNSIYNILPRLGELGTTADIIQKLKTRT